MKIVVQQGEVINRKDIESFLKVVPKQWTSAVDGLTIYVSLDEPFQISYYNKEKILGVHISSKYNGKTSEALENIAIALQAINEIGHFPNKLSKSLEKDYRARWNQVKTQG